MFSLDVFLDGSTDSLEHPRWAGRLAESTEGTVAVVNRIEVEAAAELTFSFTRAEFARMGRQALQTWPWMVLAIAIILLSWLLSHIDAALPCGFSRGSHCLAPSPACCGAPHIDPGDAARHLLCPSPTLWHVAAT